jgi:hypothetical protein
MKRTYKALAILTIMLISGIKIASSQNQSYAAFVGTYNLKLHKNDSTVIMYDYIKLEYKNDKFECYRAYKFKDPKSGKSSPEIKQLYEIVNLDTQNKTITIKMGVHKSTYKFKKNKSGAYDLIVYDKVLVYASQK